MKTPSEINILIGCEESQTVCKAFRALGFNAFSNDLKPCSGGHPEWHLQMDVFEAIKLKQWDMAVFHPTCTYLSNVGNAWFNEEKYGDKARGRKAKRDEALRFFVKLHNCGIPRICLENPVGWVNSNFRKPDQVIQPYYFGDPESKSTCLWLIGLPKLQHSPCNSLFYEKTHVSRIDIMFYKSGKKAGKPITFNDRFKISEDRQALRSKTFPGIANAMASQWGYFLIERD